MADLEDYDKLLIPPIKLVYFLHFETVYRPFVETLSDLVYDPRSRVYRRRGKGAANSP